VTLVRVRGAARVAALLVAVSAAGCGASHDPNALPDWMQLKPGAHAHLGYSNDYDPEHATLYASADAAQHGGAGVTQTVAEGTTVTVDTVQAAANGKHVVAVHTDAGQRGWVIAEDLLFPIPPAGTVFVVPARVGNAPANLFQEADDDDGVPFDGSAHVKLDGFTANPGNPEYAVEVQDGSLGGRVGFLMANELQYPATHAFHLVAP
jgi:hypothetical protein